MWLPPRLNYIKAELEGGVFAGVAFEDLGEGVEQVRSEAGEEASGGLVHERELAFEVGERRGDGDGTEGGSVPEDGLLIELGDGEVEGVAELVFEGADDLSAIFEGLCVGDGDVEGELADGHGDLAGDGRNGEIRTLDPLLPKQVRYQAALHSDWTHRGALLRIGSELSLPEFR